METPGRRTPNESYWYQLRNPDYIYIIFPSAIIISPDKTYLQIQSLNRPS